MNTSAITTSAELVNLSACLGAAIILAISVFDFRRRVTTRRMGLGLLFVLMSFCILNICLYLVLLFAVSGIKPVVGWPAFSLDEGTRLGTTHVITPLVLAFIHFWAGAGNVDIHGRTISFYGWSLDFFQAMFAPSQDTTTRISHRIEELSRQQDEIVELVERIEKQARISGWQTDPERWAKITDQLNQAAPMEQLERILAASRSERITKDKKAGISEAAELAMERIHEQRTNELRAYLDTIVNANMKDPGFVDCMRSWLKIPRSATPNETKGSLAKNLARAIALGLITAFLLTIVFGLMPDPGSDPRSAALFAHLLLPCCAVCIIFSFTGLFRHTVPGVLGSCVVGFGAVLCASIVYYALAGGVDADALNRSLWNGAGIGIVVSLAVSLATAAPFIRVIKRHAAPRNEIAYVFCIVGLLGGTGVLAVDVLKKIVDGNVPDQFWLYLLGVFFLGAVVATAAGFVSGEIENSMERE